MQNYDLTLQKYDCYDWTSEEGQSLLRMKYNLLSKYLKEHGSAKEGDAVVTEEFLNLAILEAYRLGNSTNVKSRQELLNDVCYQLEQELQLIRRNF